MNFHEKENDAFDNNSTHNFPFFLVINIFFLNNNTLFFNDILFLNNTLLHFTSKFKST
ncbi:hypothetical protein RhiirC2_740532 [Rhizophagus irregularis]|uniref:Uncharacterized protein n=1 Tax=Rhizophagus irregularis TaxID=588596 RepID=A0A2N1NI17_9GLOM|nr:hypothetical protein RhiirC2_740532 [Rhizophagus irregularis]